MGLILGGGLGNFLDRLFREPSFGQGHVIDFIRVPNWPVFNIADMAVVGGACLAVFLSLRGIDYRAAQDAPDTSDAAATIR
jgi:signal peptidase II